MNFKFFAIICGSTILLNSVAHSFFQGSRNGRVNESYSVCLSKGNSALTCSTYPDRGNDNGIGYISCLNAGNAAITCSTYPSNVPSNSNNYPRDHYQNESYSVCLSKGNSALTCSTYPDRGNDNGMGYISCLNAGNSPITCSTYPSRPNDIGAIVVTPDVIPPIPVTPDIPSSQYDNNPEFSSDETSSYNNSSQNNASASEAYSDDDVFLRVEWEKKGYTCAKLQARYPGKSFLLLHSIARAEGNKLILENPSFCLSKKDEEAANKNLKSLKVNMPWGNSARYSQLSFDSYTARIFCQKFKMLSVSNIEAFDVITNFALYRFNNKGEIIAESSGVNLNEPQIGAIQTMTQITCSGRSISKSEMMNLMPIRLR